VWCERSARGCVLDCFAVCWLVGPGANSPRPPFMSELACLSCRKGVARHGWLSKEGAQGLGRAFPSRRFFCLLPDRLEYYEEKQVQVRSGPTGIECNEWNLVVYVRPDDVRTPPVRAGDIVTACNGVDLAPLQSGGSDSSRTAERTPWGTVILSLNDKLDRSKDALCTLTVLRLKGEIPVIGAKVEPCSDGATRLRLTPNRNTASASSSRPPFVLIASSTRSRDDWVQAIETQTRGQGPGPPPLGSGGEWDDDDEPAPGP
jgi:hypothetical protein